LKRVGYINKNIQGNRVYDPNFIGPTLSANGGGWGAKTGLFDVGKIQHIINSDSQANRVYDPNGIGPTLGIGNAMSKPLVGVSNTRDFVYLSNTNANMKQREQKRSESWTLGTGTDFGIKDKMKIRRLTPLECERLQGFPDNWTKGVSDTQRYKQVGNAVTVPVVQYIAENFIYAEDDK
jgi:site-specific DNA-cytosine methylase